MPQCFQLFKKGSTEPENLNKVDEELCKLTGDEIDPKYYCRNWFDLIGWNIAVNGLQLGSKELRDKIGQIDTDNGNKMLSTKILPYLEDNYSSVSFYERKK